MIIATGSISIPSRPPVALLALAICVMVQAGYELQLCHLVVVFHPPPPLPRSRAITACRSTVAVNMDLGRNYCQRQVSHTSAVASAIVRTTHRPSYVRIENMFDVTRYIITPQHSGPSAKTHSSSISV